MLGVDIKFYNGKITNLYEIKHKLIALEERIKDEYDSWANWKLLWNCKQLEIILQNEKMLYQYVNFAFNGINVSKTNNVVILTIDKELYSFNLFTKNKVNLYSGKSNLSAKMGWIAIPIISIIASIIVMLVFRFAL